MGNQRSGRLCQPAHHHALDAVHINGLVQGLAHTHIFERVLAFDAGLRQLVTVLVHPQEQGAVGGRFQHLQVGRLFDALQVVHTRVDDEIHLARQQSRCARGI